MRIRESAIQYINGKIYTGKQHCDCFAKAFNHKEPLPTIAEQKKAGCCRKQGFITECGKFVSREEGALIALANGQIDKLRYSKTELFSEDLWKSHLKRKSCNCGCDGKPHDPDDHKIEAKNTLGLKNDLKF